MENFNRVGKFLMTKKCGSKNSKTWDIMGHHGTWESRTHGLES
jgi:hypothetical protein